MTGVLTRDIVKIQEKMSCIVVETGVTQLPAKHAKDCQPPPEGMERQGRILPRSSEGA